MYGTETIQIERYLVERKGRLDRLANWGDFEPDRSIGLDWIGGGVNDGLLVSKPRDESHVES